MASKAAKSIFEDGKHSPALPTIEIEEKRLKTGIPAYEALVTAGLAKTNSEARRLIRGGGGRINDVVISDEGRLIGLDDINKEGVIKFSAGKKRHVLMRPL